ncbi:hypothetical protein K2X33_03965, partial [bacterium]|nr:hypothetical protein [bacterium]
FALKPRAHLLALAGDAGGAAALAPVLRALVKHPAFRLDCLAYGPAKNAFAHEGLDFSAAESEGDDRWLHAQWERETPQLVLTATSHNTWNAEKQLRQMAREGGIPSVAVLDFWSNYSTRFSSPGQHLDCLADRIAIMDEFAKDAMLAEGFPEACLHVTGQPAFSSLLALPPATPEEAQALRATLGLGTQKLVLFASQPLRAFQGTALGYDEHTVLTALQQALAAPELPPTQLLIRPHPRENPEDYRRYVNLNTVLGSGGDGQSRLWMQAADLVVGMNSALLIEAFLLGRPVLSLQPGLRTADLLPINQRGSAVAYETSAIGPLLRDLLTPGPAQEHYRQQAHRFREALSPDATLKVVSLVESTLAV